MGEANGPPGGNDLGAPKIRFKRAGETFSDAVRQGYAEAGRETRGRITMGKTRCERQP